LEDTATELSRLPLGELIDRLSSRDPVPGGGSASAIAGAMGAALVGMVAELTIGRPDAEPHARELRAIRDEAARYRAELLTLAQTDATAYDAVVRARRMPRATDEERGARRAAVGEAMLAAADAPLHVARLAAATLQLAERIAPIGNPNAVSDAGVGALLSAVALRGAAMNVRINLPYLAPDAGLRATAPAELEELEAAAGAVEARTLAVVSGRLEPS
jgi:formiminotetrahydrofolate cyclodeaminase